jgi:hypothetical protein
MEQEKIIQACVCDKQGLIKNCSLSDEVKQIITMYNVLEQKDKNLIEIRTNNWLELGKIVLKHRERVEKELGKGSWTRWALTNLKVIGETRLRYIQSLPFLEGIARKYDFMGIDRVHRFQQVLLKSVVNDEKKKEFKEIRVRFGLVEANMFSTDAEKNECCKTVDKICDFVYTREALDSVEYDKNLLISAVETRCNLGKQVTEELKAMKSASERNGYLSEMIRNKSPNPEQITCEAKRESLQVLIAKIIETVDVIKSGEKNLEKLDKTLVEEGLESLVYLNSII